MNLKTLEVVVDYFQTTSLLYVFCFKMRITANKFVLKETDREKRNVVNSNNITRMSLY